MASHVLVLLLGVGIGVGGYLAYDKFFAKAKAEVAALDAEARAKLAALKADIENLLKKL